ncbi:uncharacterized protein LOC142181931 [Nicotiana tabacum]|uniref:Uncharacterized protein LOC142181931 n=1 Tax=Nicotiana tabacum TaxID=4097 RepID=A0AC58UQF9_TOBAC
MIISKESRRSLANHTINVSEVHERTALFTNKGHPNQTQFTNKTGSYPPSSLNFNPALFSNKGISYYNNNFKPRKNQLYYDYCNFKGHTTETCYKLHGYPLDFKPKKKFSSANSAPYARENQFSNNPTGGTYGTPINLATASGNPSVSLQVSNSPNNQSAQAAIGGIPQFTQEQYNQIMQMLRKGNENSGSAMAAGMTHSITVLTDKPKWIIDTGASNHMLHRLDMMFVLKHLGNSKEGKIQSFICLKNYKGVKKISVALATRSASSNPRSLTVNTTENNKINVALWNRRLGHVPLDVLKRVSVFQSMHFEDIEKHCTVCPLAKQTRLPFPASFIKAHVPLQQNGLAKRRHRHILYVARALRLLASTLKGRTLYETLHGFPASLAHLRIFGCLGYLSEVMKTDKFSPRAIPTVFLGYSIVQKGYKMYTLASKEFIMSRDVVFKEDVYSFKHIDLPISSLFPILELSPHSVSDNRVTHSTDTLTSTENPDLATDAHINTLPAKLPVDTSPFILSPKAFEPNRKSQRVSKPPLWMKDYVIQSQGKSNCCYPLSNYVSYANISSVYSSILSAHSAIIEPKTYIEVVKNLKWIEAMKSEITALEENNTWSIIDLS